MAEQTAAPSVEVTVKEQATAAPPAEVKNTDTPPPEQTVPYARFKEINDKLKELETAATKQADASAKAEEERLAHQAEWQKLADKRKADLEQLTPKVELADKLTAMVLEQYTAEIAAWPEQVKAMAPADDADVLVKLDWMRRAKPLATELMADKGVVAGNGRRPPPVSAAQVATTDAARRAEWDKRAAARYR